MINRMRARARGECCTIWLSKFVDEKDICRHGPGVGHDGGADYPASRSGKCIRHYKLASSTPYIMWLSTAASDFGISKVCGTLIRKVCALGATQALEEVDILAAARKHEL